MTSFLRTQQISTEMTAASSGVVPIFTADNDGQCQLLKAFYKGTIRTLNLEVYLPELPETDIPLSRNVNGNFVPETYFYRNSGRYLALCTRKKGDTNWLVRREFLLLRRKHVEREAIDLLSPVFGAAFFDLHQDTELGLMVQNKGAGSLGASEYIRILGAVDEQYSVLETAGTGGTTVFDWELGDYRWTAKLPTAGLQEKWGKLWAALGAKIGKPGTPDAPWLQTHDRLFALYELFWNSPHVGMSSAKGGSALEDWGALKWLELPNPQNRVLAVGDSTHFGQLQGSEQQTLSVAQLPAHAHNYVLVGPGARQVGQGSSGAYILEQNLTLTTTPAGEGQPFSIVQPTAYLARGIWVCAGDA